MRKSLLLSGLILMLLHTSIPGQKTDFYGKPIDSNPCDEQFHEADKEVDALMTRILETLGMKRNPYSMQPCHSRANCSATVKNGVEYILYNPDYLGKIKKLNFSSAEMPEDELDWAVVGVLAHEVGHHFNGHLKNPSLSDHLKELEADYQAGYILYLLGATDFLQASACLRNVPEESSITHPGRRDRILEFSKGWEEAKRKLSLNSNSNSREINADSDGDGVIDKQDDCPNEFGAEKTNGCPDSDGDGVPNKSDRCPYVSGRTQWWGCPDTDDDGIPDYEDGCPDKPGAVRTLGCPDRDNDGVADRDDSCPDRPGPAESKGCPPSDIDDDGVPDVSDRCKTVFGLKNLEGCPDKDGDGIPDIDDKCPDQKGSPLKGGCPEVTIEHIVDPLAGKMILVRGGTYKMGCSNDQSGCESDELPAHNVILDDYYIGEAEVTQSLWKSIMETRPSKHINCDECPVEMVSWEDVQLFISRLNKRTGEAQYRLPTEAEWEYAARGGAFSQNFRYSGGNTISESGWFNESNENSTRPVKGKKPNELGLYDMSGNVWEWCSDLFAPYQAGIQSNPKGPAKGSLRVCRGGSWNYPAESGRVTKRNTEDAALKFSYIGFRLARSR